MYARSIRADKSSVSNVELVSELMHTLMETATVSDQAAAGVSDVSRSTQMLTDQALTVERVFKALRAHFEGLAQVHESIAVHLPPEEAARLHEAVVELRGKLGLAAGALRRWNLGVQTCADTARLASVSMTSVRTAIEGAAGAAEQLLIT